MIWPELRSCCQVWSMFINWACASCFMLIIPSPASLCISDSRHRHIFWQYLWYIIHLALSIVLNSKVILTIKAWSYIARHFQLLLHTWEWALPASSYCWPHHATCRKYMANNSYPANATEFSTFIIKDLSHENDYKFLSSETLFVWSSPEYNLWHSPYSKCSSRIVRTSIAKKRGDDVKTSPRTAASTSFLVRHFMLYIYMYNL